MTMRNILFLMCLLAWSCADAQTIWKNWATTNTNPVVPAANMPTNAFGTNILFVFPAPYGNDSTALPGSLLNAFATIQGALNYNQTNGPNFIQLGYATYGLTNFTVGSGNNKSPSNSIPSGTVISGMGSNNTVVVMGPDNQAENPYGFAIGGTNVTLQNFTLTCPSGLTGSQFVFPIVLLSGSLNCYGLCITNPCDGFYAVKGMTLKSNFTLTCSGCQFNHQYDAGNIQVQSGVTFNYSLSGCFWNGTNGDGQLETGNPLRAFHVYNNGGKVSGLIQNCVFWETNNNGSATNQGAFGIMSEGAGITTIDGGGNIFNTYSTVAGSNYGIVNSNIFNGSGNGTVFVRGAEDPTNILSATAITWPSSEFLNVTATGNITSATNTTNHISFSTYTTNVSVGQSVTNSSGYPQQYTGEYSVTTASVTGAASLKLAVASTSGGVTNTVGPSTTVAVTLASTNTNSFTIAVPNNGVFTPSANSTGSGNSATIVSNSIQVTQY